MRYLYTLTIGTAILFMLACENAPTSNKPAILAACSQELSATAKTFIAKEAAFSVAHPADWLVQAEEKLDSRSASYLFADTSLFYTMEIINTLQVTVQEGELPDEDDFMEANIQELKRRHKVLESGIDRLNGVKSYWFLVEDPTITTLMYNLSGNGNFYTINLSTTATENSSGYLCELSTLLQSFDLQ